MNTFFSTLPSSEGLASLIDPGDGPWMAAYSGVDLRAIVYPTYPRDRLVFPQPVPLDSLTGISISEHRDKFPVRRLGTSNPAGFVKGNRTIAGTLIFAQMGEYGLRDIVKNFLGMRSMDAEAPDLYDLSALDELPPLDLIATFVNEAGSTSYFGLRGLEILDEGESFTIDNQEWYTTASYMAKAKIPMRGRLESYIQHPSIHEITDSSHTSTSVSGIYERAEDKSKGVWRNR